MKTSKKRDKDCVKTNLAFEKFVARDTMDDTASCMVSLLRLTYWLKRGEQTNSVEKKCSTIIKAMVTTHGFIFTALD